MFSRAASISAVVLFGAILVSGTPALAAQGSLRADLVPGPESSGTLSASPSVLNFSPIPYTKGEHEENQSENEQVNIEAREASVQIESVSIT
jgi:hypothetical protein